MISSAECKGKIFEPSQRPRKGAGLIPGGGRFLLAKSSLFADGAQQGEQDVLFFSTAA
jgi:hypothetical protein